MQGPTVGEREPVDSLARLAVMRTVRYRRTLRATRLHTFDAVVRAVELLRYYPDGENDSEAAEVRFTALSRTVTVRVFDADDGHCTVVVEFAALRWRAIGGSALVILPGVLLGAAIRTHDAWFANAFLDNVRRVLQDGRVGWDPARLPGMGALREKLGLAER